MTKKDKTQEPDVMIYVDENNKATIEYNLKNSGSFVPEKDKKAIREATQNLFKNFEVPKDEEVQIFHFNKDANFGQIPEETRGGTNMAEALSKVQEVLKTSREEIKPEDTNKKKPK